MLTKFIEAGQGTDANHIRNWGKFVLGSFTPVEWAQSARFPGCPDQSLLHSQGWTGQHFLLFDLATAEGALFQPGGSAAADLARHQIWVCPLFEPFLEWLYTFQQAHVSGWWDHLPPYVVLPDVEFELRGYRREGPPLTPREQEAIRAQAEAESRMQDARMLAETLAGELTRWSPLIEAAKAAMAALPT